MVNKFQETDSVHNQVFVGAKQSAREHTQERQEEACRLRTKNPCISITHLSQQLVVSRSTTYHIEWEDIGLLLHK